MCWKRNTGSTSGTAQWKTGCCATSGFCALLQADECDERREARHGGFKVGAAAVTTPGVVEVLLGTYNGERFLREQIDSILEQDYPSVRILARDDASTDGTMAILSHYAEQAPERFTVLPGREASGGAQWNFLRLMQASEAAFVCFADQDDVWLPDKISRSMRALHDLEARYGADVPLLVFSDLRVVDEELHSLHESYWANEVICADDIHRLPRILQQNVVTGCTATLNRALVKSPGVAHGARSPDARLLGRAYRVHHGARRASERGNGFVSAARRKCCRRNHR